MKIEVFNYTWIPENGDGETAGLSPQKVTKKYFEYKRTHGSGTEYQIIEGSRDLVESSMIVDGKYHRELQVRM
jgi:hypothetical protein